MGFNNITSVSHACSIARESVDTALSCAPNHVARLNLESYASIRAPASTFLCLEAGRFNMRRSHQQPIRPSKMLASTTIALCNSQMPKWWKTMAHHISFTMRQQPTSNIGILWRNKRKGSIHYYYIVISYQIYLLTHPSFHSWSTKSKYKVRFPGHC